MKRSLLSAILLTALAAVVGCGGPRPWNLNEPDVHPTDQDTLEKAPKERDPSLYWDAVNQSSFYLVERSLDLPRQYRKLTGQLKEAYNADCFGEIPDCSWFTNRHGRSRLTAAELTRGPRTIGGPDTSETWTITRAKTEGVTPGFFVKDARGETFVLKFDPIAHPELATGAEMVSTSIFHAIGYNVPENYLVIFDPSILTIKDGLQFKTRRGEQEPFTPEVLARVLGKVARRPDGRIRAIASRLLPGKPLGPFSYHGLRKDDPNDLIPHQHRRELRGLKIFAEFTNHFDTKDHNSLDILVDDSTGRYVRHYLIDFGSTLGSDGDEPKAVYKGYAYVFDLEQALVSLGTLGLRQWSWEGAKPDGIPASVGYFESDIFDPPGWKPLQANQAFDDMTHNDAFWAARILAQFSEDDIRACVAAGEYSDPAASEYLVRTLRERQQKILGYYYSKVNPLDDFRLSRTGENLTLTFADRWVDDGVGPADRVTHRARIGQGKGSWTEWRDLGRERKITIDSEVLSQISDAIKSARSDYDQVFNIQIESHRDGAPPRWVRVYFYLDDALESPRIVGIERET
ncbi:MAG: hypothetical protein AB1752_04385 [Candidatus Zixiibacteriota bacterium]